MDPIDDPSIDPEERSAIRALTQVFAQLPIASRVRVIDWCAEHIVRAEATQDDAAAAESPGSDADGPMTGAADADTGDVELKRDLFELVGAVPPIAGTTNAEYADSQEEAAEVIRELFELVSAPYPADGAAPAPNQERTMPSTITRDLFELVGLVPPQTSAVPPSGTVDEDAPDASLSLGPDVFEFAQSDPNALAAVEPRRADAESAILTVTEERFTAEALDSMIHRLADGLERLASELHQAEAAIATH